MKNTFLNRFRLRGLGTLVLWGFAQLALAQLVLRQSVNTTSPDILPPPPNPAGPVLIRNGNLIEVETGRVRQGVSLLLEGGLIRKIGANLTAPAAATVIDATGKWLMPGLVDAHMHLFQSGSLYARPDGIDLTNYRPYETERQWLRQQMGDLLRRYLACGITTVVDVGGPMYQYPYRDRYNQQPASPTILLTGPLISTYLPPAFANLTDSPILKAATPDEARQQVRRQLPARPDFTKIWYIVRGVGASEQAQAMVQAAIDESHKNGLKVAIHTQELLAAKLGVKFGADFLVHSPEDGLIDDELITLMKQRNVSYCPTMLVTDGIARFLGNANLTPHEFRWANPWVTGTLFDSQHLPEPTLVNRLTDYANGPFLTRQQRRDSITQENLRRAWRAGINVVTGTDAGNMGTFHGTSYIGELRKMQAAGLTNADLLRASTLNGARLFGREAQVGTLAEGKQANLLILPQNPLADLNALTQLETVVNRGYVYTPAQLLPDTPEALAQRQLNAYNARDIDAFLEPYADDVEIYNHPNELTYKGKEAMRKRYGEMFAKLPALHCELVNRTVMGNTVIDHERVTFGPARPAVEAIAIYKVENGKISRVYFVR
jgi:imidazolonepropionase-like amidohydrolase